MRIYTPLGKAELPDSYADEYKAMTDIELLEELVRQNNTKKGLLDPILVSILIDKKLLLRGEKCSDVQAKIQKLKSLELVKEVCAKIKDYCENWKQYTNFYNYVKVEEKSGIRVCPTLYDILDQIQKEYAK